ncbi:PD40 domain-containing protein [candidate division KSB1 bacterium]|nr:PD40 domain-containing protein [candidate division KSB1 bacterium]
MKKFRIYTAALILLFVLLVSQNCARVERDIQKVDRLPEIFPDYRDLVLPVNIAPTNFKILEKGQRFIVTVGFPGQRQLVIRSARPDILIPSSKWKKGLKNSVGKAFTVQIDVLMKENIWQRFKPIENRVVADSIDGYLVYRRIKPIHNFWGSMGIYERNLSDFTERPLLLNRTLDNGCINCHVFYQKKPDRMVLHTRGTIGVGMLIVEGEKVVKVDTRTPFNKGPVVFRSWHPNGQILATSVNHFIQFFHATGESREVLDLSSDLLLYHFDSNKISTVPAIASPDRMETFPCWSDDGKVLYFCSAPKLQSYLQPEDKYVSTIYHRVKYDLNKIGYDPATDTWGQIEPLLPASVTGKSVLMPSLSPDGKFLLFCMADYGCFPVLLKSSDIYIMNMKTGQYRKPDINSNQAESNYSWSSNSRWFVFGSKRMDGLCARPYFCYVDTDGKVSKPFILPQKETDYYEKILDSYNVPEFLTAPVKTSWQALTRAALDNDRMVKAVLDERVKLDAVSGASPQPTWQQPLH